MTTQKTYWVDFKSVSISIDYKQFCKIVNCCEENKISFDVKNEIVFHDYDDDKNIIVNLIIDECWATTLVTELAKK